MSLAAASCINVALWHCCRILQALRSVLPRLEVLSCLYWGLPCFCPHLSPTQCSGDGGTEGRTHLPRASPTCSMQGRPQVGKAVQRRQPPCNKTS